MLMTFIALVCVAPAAKADSAVEQDVVAQLWGGDGGAGAVQGGTGGAGGQAFVQATAATSDAAQVAPLAATVA